MKTNKGLTVQGAGILVIVGAVTMGFSMMVWNDHTEHENFLIVQDAANKLAINPPVDVRDGLTMPTQEVDYWGRTMDVTYTVTDEYIKAKVSSQGRDPNDPEDNIYEIGVGYITAKPASDDGAVAELGEGMRSALQDESHEP